MAKKGTIQQKYSAEFKIGVIMDMREHHMGYRETVRKYWDVSKGQEANYKNAVQRWERIYLEEGAEGLMKERRGRAGAASGTKKGRPPKLDKKVEEDLIAENQRLRMEIEYLKKLDALVQKRLHKERKKQQ
ncbi:MAG: helix-turn-helix domain-containing protein [Oscillospiraceae bacterium]|jgi:transposase IS3/IS911 family protein|nr:helix-turn-helix domain-containing protein [Oscillospiraceae bacterium]MDY5311506.1 helix-turn-helix domain-containing protein [Oscillospiraceae bacterium]